MWLHVDTKEHRVGKRLMVRDKHFLSTTGAIINFSMMWKDSNSIWKLNMKEMLNHITWRVWHKLYDPKRILADRAAETRVWPNGSSAVDTTTLNDRTGVETKEKAALVWQGVRNVQKACLRFLSLLWSSFTTFLSMCALFTHNHQATDFNQRKSGNVVIALRYSQ